MGQVRPLAARLQIVRSDLGRKIVHPVASRRVVGWWDRLADAERGRFALWLPVFMGAGVLAYYALTVEPPWWIGASGVVVGFAAAIVLPARPTLRAIGLSLGFASLGFASAQFATARAPPIEAALPSRAVMASGTVRSVEILSGSRRITLTG